MTDARSATFAIRGRWHGRCGRSPGEEGGLSRWPETKTPARQAPRPGANEKELNAMPNIPQTDAQRHPERDGIDEEIDRLAREAATALSRLIDESPLTAFGLIQAAAMDLPDYPRPTGWANRFLPRDVARMLADEIAEEIVNWADLATQFDLTVAALASLQRLRPALRRRVLREVAGQ
jgi:hypothetical protein